MNVGLFESLGIVNLKDELVILLLASLFFKDYLLKL